jgi:hypothetical protein
MRYTLESRKDIITQVTTDAVAILINAPIYGGTTPNLSQLQALDAIKMEDIVKYELTGTYKRFIFPPLLLVEETIGDQIFATIEAPVSFTTAIVNATHICYVYKALVTGATEINFNNRGNVQGIPLLVKPISNTPITLNPPATLDYTFNIKLGSG